jgi:hypothetical protein
LGFGLDGAHEGEAGGGMGDLFACAGDAVTELYGGCLEGGEVVLSACFDGMDEVLQVRR